MSDSKQHILDIALTLFLQKGFKEVTMRDIVEQTGLSKGAVYHYFESKEVLFLEIVQNTFSSKLFASFDNYENKTLFEFYHDYIDTTIRQRLMHFDDNNTKTASAYAENHIAMIFDALKIYPEFRNRMTANRKRELLIWKAVVNKARESGEISTSLSDDQIVMIFLYTGNGIGLEIIMNKNTENMANEYFKLWDSFYESIKA